MKKNSKIILTVIFFLLLSVLLLIAVRTQKTQKKQASLSAVIVRDFINIVMHSKIMEGDKLFDYAKKYYAKSNWKAPKGYTLIGYNIDNIPIEILKKDDLITDKLILQLHGGAYLLSLIDIYRDNALRYIELAVVSVMSVDYRVAPENVFPAALEDALRAWDFALELGYKPENIILVGDSAGGNLALALTLTLRDLKKEMPKALILMSPWTDFTCSGKSHIVNQNKDPIFGNKKGSNPNLSDKSLVFSYAGNTPLNNSYLSPYFAEYNNFPSMFIQVGTDEILEDDAVMVYEKAIKAGVKVKLTKYEGMFHVFQLLTFLPESKKAWQEVGEFIAGHL